MAKIEEHTDLLPRSAGRLMTKKMPVISPQATIKEVEDLLIKKTRELETVNYIYVIDNDHKLMGVISIKEVFRSPKATQVTQIMHKNIVSVKPHTDQSRVALLAIENRLKEIPVTDQDGRFIGVVPYDIILNVMNQEHIDDALKTAGIHQFKDAPQTITTASAESMVKKRLPWLFIGLGGSAIAALIISSFKEALESRLILAAFIPAVTYITDAVGTQSETILIRNAALEKNFRILKYLKREIIVGLALAFCLSVATALISYILWADGQLSFVLAITIFLSIIISMMIATLLPWFSARLKIDPAVVGGPLDTIVSDITSILVYFSVASLIFKILE